MKGLRLFGDYALEILVITLLLTLSALSVIFFVPMLVGVTGFFKNNIDTRRFKDIFTTIGRNWKILIFYTLFQLVIIVLPILNIYYLNTHAETMNFISYFVLAVSCIALLVGAVFLTTAPTVIANMDLTFRQLLYNGVMLVFGGALRSLICVACVAGVFALFIFYPFAVILTLYPVTYLISRLMNENILKLKAKALNVSVYELKKKPVSDDYLDENGRINREETEEEVENENDEEE